MTTEKDDTEQRTRRTASTAGAMGAAAAVGVAAGVAAGALLDETTESEGATPAPAARDPFDDLVPPAPAAPPAVAEADAPTATTGTPSVIDTDDSVNPVVATRPTEVPDAGAAPMPAAPAPAASAPVAPAPTVETAVADQPVVVAEPVVEQPVVEQPVVEQPVVEEPLAVQPPVAEQPTEQPTEPPAVLPPFQDMPIGVGMEPMEPLVFGGGTGDDLIVAGNDAAGVVVTIPVQPNDVLPFVPATPIDPMPPVDVAPIDPPTMPPPPEAEAPAVPPKQIEIDGGVDPDIAPAGVPVSDIPVSDITVTVPAAAPVVPAKQVEIDVVDGPKSSIFDTVNQAWAMVNARVAAFGKLSMQDIDTDDKIELWQAIKELNPTLSGGPLKLQNMNYEDWTLEKVAESFHVDIRTLAGKVVLESNENMTIADFAKGKSAASVTITPEVISVAIDGQIVQFAPGDGVAIFNSQEGTFQPIDLAGSEHHTPEPDNEWGWLFYIDD